jgi:hypothetical protein
MDAGSTASQVINSVFPGPRRGGDATTGADYVYRALLFPVSRPPSAEFVDAVVAATNGGAAVIATATEYLSDDGPTAVVLSTDPAAAARQVDDVWGAGFAGAFVSVDGSWAIEIDPDDAAFLASREPGFVRRLMQAFPPQEEMIVALLAEHDYRAESEFQLVAAVRQTAAY